MLYKVLLIGSGGREHALAWKISQSKQLSELYALPGNPGMASVARIIPGSVTDFESIRRVIIEKNIDIVVVGPEDPLVRGLKDYLREDPSLADLLFVGPDKYGASLEGSKDFAKEFMMRHGIPTASYRTFKADELSQALTFLSELKPPYVLKADGLAAGKGVLIPETLGEAEASLKEIFSGKFGAAGERVVIEEFLRGVEVSCFILTDGNDYLLLPEAKDYKRASDGDRGLNTGGMGAVSPVPFADEEFMRRVKERIVEPTVRGLREDGADYRGFIFAGLMNCGGDPYVIEYNVRMGDPETEAVMCRIESDLLSHLVAAAQGRLSHEKIEISAKWAVTGIVVSGGYPGEYKKGYRISGLENLSPDTVLFHSGTALSDGEVVTSGGRVLALTALGENLRSAREILYSQIDKITFKDSFHRNDIAKDMIEWGE